MADVLGLANMERQMEVQYTYILLHQVTLAAFVQAATLVSEFFDP